MYKDTKKKKNTTSTDVFSILAELIFYVSCSTFLQNLRLIGKIQVMKRLFIILFAVTAAVWSASGQEKQHALEITTGYPNILFQFEFPWMNTLVEMSDEGKDVSKEYYQGGINIGYTYSWKKRWEVSTLLNLHLTMYDVVQYPMLSPGDENHDARYDFDAEPTFDYRSTSVYGAISCAVRFKWLVRECVSMYSALGGGVSLGFPIPMPYIAPVGIKFGKGKVYGMIEANVSPATTFGMAGIGIRL